MSDSSPEHRSRVRQLTRWAGALWFAFSATEASASCFASLRGEISQLERQTGRDPLSVTRMAPAILARVANAEPHVRAEYYAVFAGAWSALDSYEEALRAVDEGLALVSDPRDPTFLNLISIRISNTYAEQGAAGETERIRTLLEQQIPGSPGEACLLIALGQLAHQGNRPDEASIHLTRAYRMSTGQERRQQRVRAADTLSLVMRDLRNFPQALALNREVIDWDTERDASFDLATSRFIRGAIYREMGDHKAALVELEASRRLSLAMNDEQSVAYDHLLMCLSHIELGTTATARQLCQRAHDVFVRVQSSEPEKQALTSLARLDLLGGDAGAALARLNRVLDQDGRDVVSRRLVEIYELRAQAHAALGNHQQALADFMQHMRRFKAATDAERAREAASLRARFETDREIERNQALQRELVIRSERLQEQASRLRWLIMAGAVAAAMIASLTWLLLINRQQRQLLRCLAEQDELTGLPNRRRTLEVARGAFDRARREQCALTVGILDLDHFKRINDRFGHAAGDRVLQAFAQMGCTLIREGDVLGRWGGEEFLIVLPDTTLDVALGVVQRIRAGALGIEAGKLAEGLKVSLSAGLATNEGDPQSLDELVARADAALYEAKNSGRDLVRVAKHPAERGSFPRQACG